MGDGATNESVVSGMLPAESNTVPYVLTYSGLLQDTLFAESGPIWKAFDQLPVETGVTSTDDEFLNCKWGVDEEAFVGLRTAMVDLGEGNEKCFDKFRYRSSWSTAEYYPITKIIIQGSNSVSCAADNAIDSSNWVELYRNMAVGYNNNRGEWQSWITWINVTAYRYYRIIASGTWESEGTDDYLFTNNSSWAASEFMFVEEEEVPLDTTIVYVPPVILGISKTVGSLTKVGVALSRSSLSIPSIILAITLSHEIYSQYLGIDENTVLMLHFDGEAGTGVFPDSSQYEHIIAKYGSPEIYSYSGYNPMPGWNGVALFRGYHFVDSFTSTVDVLSITNHEKFDLGVGNSPFCIDLWFRFTNPVVSEETLLIRAGDANAGWNSVYGIAYKLIRAASGVEFQFNIGNNSYDSVVASNLPYEGSVWTGTEWIISDRMYHVAVTYDGTTTRIFGNGLLQDQSTSEYVKPTSCSNLSIAATLAKNSQDQYTNSAIVMLNEFRISDIARWVGNFEPPTEPYIEKITDRVTATPAVSVLNCFSAKAFVSQSILPILEIITELSLSLLCDGGAGWKVSVPSINIIVALDIPVFAIKVLSVINTANIFSIKFFVSIPSVSIPIIVNTIEQTVVDVFLGSKIQTPVISMKCGYSMFISPAGWYELHPRAAVPLAYGGYKFSDNGMHILVYNYSLHEFNISHDEGLTWSDVTPPYLFDEPATPIMVTLSDDGNHIVLHTSVYTYRPNETIYQVTWDSGITWDEYKVGEPILMPTIGAHAYENPRDRFYVERGTLHPSKLYNSLEYPVVTTPFPDYDETDITPAEVVLNTPATDVWLIGSKNSAVLLLVYGEGCTVHNVDIKAFFSVDRGNTWLVTEFPIQGLAYFDNSIDYISDIGSVILVKQYRYVSDSIFKQEYIVSVDSGASWAVVEHPEFTYTAHDVTYYLRRTLVISSTGRVGVVRAEGYPLYISTDYLTTWSELKPWGDTDIGELRYVSDAMALTYDGSTLYIERHVEYNMTTNSTVFKVDILSQTSQVVCPNKYYAYPPEVFPEAVSRDGSAVLVRVDGRLMFSNLSNKIWWDGLFTEEHTTVAASMSGDNGNIILAEYSRNTDPHRYNAFSEIITESLTCLSYDFGNTYTYSIDIAGYYSTRIFIPGTGFGVNRSVISGDGSALFCGALSHRFIASGTKAGFYRSTDQGITWEKASTTGWNSEVNNMNMLVWWDIASSYDGTIIFASGDYMLYRCFSGLWTVITPEATTDFGQMSKWRMVCDDSGDIVVAVGTYVGVSWDIFGTEKYSRLFISTNSGTSWAEISTEWISNRLLAAPSISADGIIILIGTKQDRITASPGQLFLSSDQGETWTEQLFSAPVSQYPLRQTDGPNRRSFSETAMSADGSALYAGGLEGLWTNATISSEPVTLLISISDI